MEVIQRRDPELMKKYYDMAKQEKPHASYYTLLTMAKEKYGRETQSTRESDAS